MKEHISKTIEELKGHVDAKERKLTDLKHRVDEICVLLGEEPVYSKVDEKTVGAGEKEGIKSETKNAKTAKTKPRKTDMAGSPGKPAAKIKYIKSGRFNGVRRTPSGKWEAKYYDPEKKQSIYIGTFADELLAAAAIQKKHGNYGAAHKIMEEYQEGDGKTIPDREVTEFMAGG